MAVAAVTLATRADEAGGPPFKFHEISDNLTARAEVACPAGARCGTLTVPLDRADSSAGTIDIAYALLPHTDASRPALGTVAPNPGGPGSPTIADASTWTELLGPLRKRRDLLLIDARGTGQSGALPCPSLASQDPTTIDLQGIAATCGADLGMRARYYGSAAIADDFDAVRAALGIDKLDLWGQSWGTLLMPIYAARHPEHVRSIVLSGAQPIAFDPWARDLLRASKRAIRLVCRRTHACSGKRVLRHLGVLVRRVRRHPVPFSAPTPDGRVHLHIGERELAELTYARGIPIIYGLLPAALRAAVDGDYAPLKRLAATARVSEIVFFSVDPSIVSWAQLTATTCHDYPKVFDLAAAPAIAAPSTRARSPRSPRPTSLRSRRRPGSSPTSGERRPASTLSTRPRDRPWRADRSPTSPCSCSPATSTRTPRSSRAG